MSIAVITLAAAAPLSGVASTASATASATELGSPEAVESLQILSHEAARETPANRAPVMRRPVVVDGATIDAETADQVALAVRALGRFESLGLELPEVEVRLFSDFSGCADPANPSRERSYLLIENGEYTIFMCGPEFALLHELAHVWDHSQLTDAERARFLAKRGLEHWAGVEWARAGGEHLADVLAWGLQASNARPSRTKPNDDDSLREAFEVATGAQPLG